MKHLLNKIDRFNFWLMSGLADLNSTPWAFYLVSFAVLKSLTFQRPADALGWINFVVQTFYQGAALPLISFISKREGALQQRLIQETHDIVIAELQLLKAHIKGETS